MDVVQDNIESIKNDHTVSAMANKLCQLVETANVPFWGLMCMAV